MKMPDHRVMALSTVLVTIMLAGCDPRSEEPTSENQSTTRSFQAPRSALVSSRASQDDSLYRQILETMQQENKALKRQIQETVEKYTELETLLNEIKLERDVAFKAYIKVSESIESLETDAGSKDRRINELEQANEIQEQTIAQLNQQLSQVLLELNNSSSDIINDNTVIDPDR